MLFVLEIAVKTKLQLQDVKLSYLTLLSRLYLKANIRLYCL